MGLTQRVQPFNPLICHTFARYIENMTNGQSLSLQIKTLYPGQYVSDQDLLDAGQRLTEFVKILMEIKAQQPQGLIQ